MVAAANLRGTALEVLRAFGRLGLRGFGGPAAHLALYRQEFVVRRRWLDAAAYADTVALCQFLPGPASSQVRGDQPMKKTLSLLPSRSRK
jgi:chromate transporter